MAKTKQRVYIDPPINPAAFNVTATINLPDGSDLEQKLIGYDLNTVWRKIKQDYPTVTSVVLVFTTPEAL